MPRYGKYARRKSYRSRRFTRAGAASSIARAWRAKKRRRTGLTQRTVLANRRQIRQIKKATETKVMQAVQAVSGQQFNGQFADNIVVDDMGQETVANLPFAGDLIACRQGTRDDERVGNWIQLKSMTMHYCISCPVNAAIPDCHFELFVVLDREPSLGASLTGNATGLLQLESAQPQPNNWLSLAFQSLKTTGGKEGRYKILARKKHRLSNTSLEAVTVPQIATSAAPGGGFTNVTRAAYSFGVATSRGKAYPSYVNGSINLKLAHKINFGSDVSSQAENQTLRIFAFQCAPPSYTQPQCRLQYYTRLRYKDA